MDTLNDYIPIFLIVNFVIFLLGFILLNKLGGIAKNFPFFIVLCTYFQYIYVTAIYNFYNGNTTIHQISVKDYFGIGFLCYGIATLLTIVGYIITSQHPAAKQKSAPKDRKYYQPRLVLLFLFPLFFFLSISDLIINGVDIVGIITGQLSNTLGGATENNYLQAFCDSLITIVLLSYLFNVPRPLFYLFFIASLILFLFYAFRYRIIITILGLFGIYVHKKGGLPLRKGLQYILVLLIGVYFMMFISVNRWIIAYGGYKYIEYNPLEYEYDHIFYETRGFLPDLAIFRYYHINENAEHDYGISMFGYIFVRAIPSNFFPEGKKPYPPPSLQIVIDSLQPDRHAKNYGEAVLNLAHFQISFGLIGLFVMSFLLGVILRYLKSFTDRNYSMEAAFMISLVIGMGLFQFITRGYLPQIAQNYAYLFIPLLAFLLLTKKKIVLR